MNRYLLELVVFVCGAVVMVYEIVGSRVVAPYFGTSIYVWTSLIGVILASLSLGYWLGGRLADRRASMKMLAYIIFGAAIFVLLNVAFKDLMLGFLGNNLKGLMWRTLFAALLLFAPASIFLGMVSPYAVRLKIINVQTSGRTVGNLYAISTIGSIAGTFIAGFLLIPLIGTVNILYALALILILLALIIYPGFLGKGDRVFYILVLLAAAYGAYDHNTGKDSVIRLDTRYNHVQIFNTNYWENGKPVRVMKVNNEYSSAIYPGSDSLVYEYLQFFRLAEHFNAGFSSALVIGGAGYSYPRYYLQQYPDATLDVVELDPALTRLAKTYFRLEDDPRMTIHHEDGRTFLNKRQGKYDVIFVDAFKSLLSVPFQLTTIEAVTKEHDMLNENGIVVKNIVASLEGPASVFLRSSIATYKEVFPKLYVFACHDPADRQRIQSVILVASKSAQAPPMHHHDATLNTYLGHVVDVAVPEGTPVLTDDHAPVEYYAHRAL